MLAMYVPFYVLNVVMLVSFFSKNNRRSFFMLGQGQGKLTEEDEIFGSCHACTIFHPLFHNLSMARVTVPNYINSYNICKPQ